ncbi:MAG TPA: hypothetical protein VHV32_14280, partial [Candidatus Angelobacter sp.]|nr:hypothetical protein [Candidatus Angelobacter sp.]
EEQRESDFALILSLRSTPLVIFSSIKIVLLPLPAARERRSPLIACFAEGRLDSFSITHLPNYSITNFS